MASNRGLIIAIEGLDGSGKTTQARKLKEFLASQGFNVVLLKEPTDGEIGQKIRRILNSGDEPDQWKMVELYAEDRRENVEKNIIPHLKKGDIVILDRYVVSSLAYQSVGGPGFGEILEKNRFAPPPDIIIILDISEDEAVGRLKTAGKNIDSFEKKEFLKKVKEKYFKLVDEIKRFRGWENTEIIVVDASKDPDAVFNEIKWKVINIIRRRLRNVK
ncbi:MAG: dTMP kinase [Candidatus Njordarchaeia archaeon]